MRRPRLAEVTEGFVDSGGRGGGERGPRRTRSRGEPGTTAGPIRRAGRGLGPGECRRSAPSAGPRAGGGGAAPPRNRRCRPAPRRDRGDGAVTSGRPGSGRAPRGCARGRGCGRGAARLLCSPGGDRARTGRVRSAAANGSAPYPFPRWKAALTFPAPVAMTRRLTTARRFAVREAV